MILFKKYVYTFYSSVALKKTPLSKILDLPLQCLDYLHDYMRRYTETWHFLNMNFVLYLGRSESFQPGTSRTAETEHHHKHL